MSTSTTWFILLALLSVLAYVLGLRIGRGSRPRAWEGMAVAFALLGVWVWLQKHPMVEVQVIPVRILSYLEGVGATPIFMVILGLAWTLARVPRQRRVTILAVGLGLTYFLSGGFWMLQTTPRSVMGRTIPRDGLVYQSQEYSCVAAACATALNRLGLRATEAEMADLTQTRPGTGATLIRAMDGLNQRLAGASYSAQLLQPSYADLLHLPTPMLTPLQVAPASRHMVVIERVGLLNVLVADPLIGDFVMPREDFEEVYIQQVVGFVRRTKP